MELEATRENSEAIGENAEYNNYVSMVRWKWGGTIAATVAASALTIASLVAGILAIYAVTSMPGSSYAFYHSVKVIVMGTLGAGLGVVLITKLVRYAREVYRELQETKDDGRVREILLEKQTQYRKELDEIEAIRGKTEGKLEGIEENQTACKIVDDVERNKYEGWELALLGSVVVVTAVVMVALGLNSMIAGGVIAHDLTWMWLGCGVGVIIGAGLLGYGVYQIRSTRKMAMAIENLSIEEHRDIVAQYLDTHFNKGKGE